MTEAEIIEGLAEGRAGAVRGLLDRPFEAGVRALAAGNSVMAWIAEEEDTWDNRDIEWCDRDWYADFLVDRSRLEDLFATHAEALAEEGFSRLIMDRFDELVRTNMDHYIPSDLPAPVGTPASHWWYAAPLELPALRSPDPLDVDAVAAALASILEPTSYLERRRRQAAAMATMATLGRACMSGSLEASTASVALSGALTDEYQLIGWLVRGELEIRYQTWPIEEVLEHRTGLQFLIELRPNWPEGETLSDFADLWDDEIAQRREPRPPAPPNTPTHHTWWGPSLASDPVRRR